MCPRNMKDRVLNRIGELDQVNLQNFIQMISKEHRFLSSLFDSLREAILVISPAHTVLYHNAAAQEFLGLPDNASALPVEKLMPGVNLNLLLSDSGGGAKSMRQERPPWNAPPAWRNPNAARRSPCLPPRSRTRSEIP